jgi:hypothetical protein
LEFYLFDVICFTLIPEKYFILAMSLVGVAKSTLFALPQKIALLPILLSPLSRNSMLIKVLSRVGLGFL